MSQIDIATNLVAFVISLDLLAGEIATIWVIVNPDKLWALARGK